MSGQPDSRTAVAPSELALHLCQPRRHDAAMLGPDLTELLSQGVVTQPCRRSSSPGRPPVPVLADDPEAVARACQMAAAWRARFKRDSVVELVGYRR